MSKAYETESTTPRELEAFPPVLQARHIMEILGVCEAVAYQVMHNESCPTIKMGKRMVVPRDLFWSFLMAHTKERLW